MAQLNLPTEGMLKVAAPPRDLRVALLSIDMDGTTVAAPPSDRVTRAASLPFRVTAESPSAAEMAGYVAYLGDRPHVVTAYLLRHEVAENEPAKPYRFTVELAWRE